MKKVRYGILNTAQIVPRFVTGVKESASGEVVAIASRSMEKARKMAEALAIPLAYGSYEELLRIRGLILCILLPSTRGTIRLPGWPLKSTLSMNVSCPACKEVSS